VVTLEREARLFWQHVGGLQMIYAVGTFVVFVVLERVNRGYAWPR